VIENVPSAYFKLYFESIRSYSSEECRDVSMINETLFFFSSKVKRGKKNLHLQTGFFTYSLNCNSWRTLLLRNNRYNTEYIIRNYIAGRLWILIILWLLTYGRSKIWNWFEFMDPEFQNFSLNVYLIIVILTPHCLKASLLFKCYKSKFQ